MIASPPGWGLENNVLGRLSWTSARAQRDLSLLPTTDPRGTRRCDSFQKRYDGCLVPLASWEVPREWGEEIIAALL